MTNTNYFASFRFATMSDNLCFKGILDVDLKVIERIPCLVLSCRRVLMNFR